MMPRPNYVNYSVPPGGHRETWLQAVCDGLGLEYEHRDYLVAIDTALAAMVAGVTNQTKGEDEMRCKYCGQPVTKTQLKHAEAIKTRYGEYYHTDCIDDTTRHPEDAYHRKA